METPIVRIATVRAAQDDKLRFEGLDAEGEGSLGEINLGSDPIAFAIATAMLATGKAVYYSYPIETLSTDNTFGDAPAKTSNPEDGAVRVRSVDGVWRRGHDSAKLVITLVDGTIIHKHVNDIMAFIGWVNMLNAGAMELDGDILSTLKP